MAKRAGLDPASFNKSKRFGPDGRKRWPSTESVSKVLEATGASVDQFFGYAFGKATQTMQPSGAENAIPCSVLRRPVPAAFSTMAVFRLVRAGMWWNSSPERKQGVYALEVQGESMMPLYRDGDILIVEPGAQVRRGDRVVLKSRDGEVMAKVLARQSPKNIELLSLNPEHPNRSFDMADVEWIARIIWASQ